MIPRAYIQEWRGRFPWVSNEQVEQDLVISRALVEIFSDPQLRDALAFRGGTALHKLAFPRPERYSEDIDLVQLRAEPIGPTLSTLRARLDPWLGEPKRRVDEMVTLRYSFVSESIPPVPLRLKVEINTREHDPIEPLRHVPHRVQSRWWSGEAEITSYTLEELLATKLRALYQRRKGRDAFDLDVALQMSPGPDLDKIVHIFLQYMEREGRPITRAELEKNLHEKRENLIFLNDMDALVASSAPRFDPLSALNRIERELVSRLPGAPWKRPTPST